MAEPYYQDEHVTLYLGDCLEVGAWLDADVLVTDPPYGVRNHFNHKAAVVGDNNTDVRDAALVRWGSKPALVFGKWTATRPEGTRARLIWNKCGGFTGDLSLPWGSAEEEIYVLGGGFVGRREGNVITVQMLMSGDRERPQHPTPKPVPLLERLIQKCPQGIVADPFAGSGSTLIAARNLGRRAIGVEIEERYCELIASRIAQGALDFGEVS